MGSFIDEIQASKLKNVTIEKNDVLLNITGASVARCCIVPNEVLPARVNQHVSILRPNDRINAEFLASLLICQPMKNFLLNTSGAGATREALTKLQLQSLQLILPPFDLQRHWQRIFQKYNAQKQTLLTQLQQQENLFQSLQQRAFNGEL